MLDINRKFHRKKIIFTLQFQMEDIFNHTCETMPINFLHIFLKMQFIFISEINCFVIFSVVSKASSAWYFSHNLLTHPKSWIVWSIQFFSGQPKSNAVKFAHGNSKVSRFKFIIFFIRDTDSNEWFMLDLPPNKENASLAKNFTELNNNAVFFQMANKKDQKLRNIYC